MDYNASVRHDDGGRVCKRRRIDQAEEDGRRYSSSQHLSNTQELAKQHGHCIGNVEIRDDARAHLGDNYITNNYYATEELEEATYRTLLASLAFDRMDARLHNVATALPTTCDWLPNHLDFLAWIDDDKVHEHHGFLWIKGKPGSGKSTIMKETLTWAEQAWSNQLILSYFFNARSLHPLEKSSLGLYRSLLHQLLQLLSSARTLFVTKFASKVRKKKVEDWTEIELQNFLIQLVRTLRLPSITVFIDALDEGADDDVRRMIKFLETLTQYAAPKASPLRVCLSSRHYPHISVARSRSLIVEDQAEHGRDIELYIRSQLVGEDSPEINHLQGEIQDRSAGVFLWVVLVVPMLNKAYDQGKTTAVMLRKLATIPTDMHKFFTQILSRDLDDLNECITLLQWVLYSKQPLGPTELYHAVQRGSSQTEVNGSLSIAVDVATRYLLNCSRGLVELTKTEEPTVQFIHETVRDYLTRGHLLEQGELGPSLSHVSKPDFRADVCDGKLSEICLSYMLQVFQKVSSYDEEVYRQHPLVKYAAEFWWEHLQFSRSPSNGRELDLALELLTGSQSSLLLWVQLYDIDRRAPNPYKRMSDLLSPLYYAALIGRQELVCRILALGVDIDADGPYGTALCAASLKNHEKVVQVLLEWGADVNAGGKYFGTALQMASLCGHEKMVQMLLDWGANIDADDVFGTALQVASREGHEEVVQILLDRGTDINADPSGRIGTALHLASVNRHEKVVQMLLDRGAYVNAEVEGRGTALHLASEHRHENVKQILMPQGVRKKQRSSICRGRQGSLDSDSLLG